MKVSPARLQGVAWLVAALVLVAALGLALSRSRRSLLRAVLSPGEPRLPAPRARPVSARPLAKVRVLLLDGLGRAQADKLPALRALCAAGVSLDIDVGFPTVSLPVQHALWTGLWQAQSGLLFVTRRVQARAPTIPAALAAAASRAAASDAGPAAKAIAIAESHCEIAGSFGFVDLQCPPRGEPPIAPRVMLRDSLAAVGSSAALVFVHLLAIDAVGHRVGSSSPAYARQAERGDALVAALSKARGAGETLLVLSDHGHLPGGGHGGDEPSIRHVRCCAAGPGLSAGARGRGNMVDVNRLISDQLGLAPLARSQGRPLAKVLSDATPPAPPAVGPPLWARAGAFAALLVLVALVVLAWRRGGGVVGALLALPWGVAAILIAYAVRRGGLPSLSHSEVYPTFHAGLRPMLYVVLVALLLQLWLLARHVGHLLAGALVAASLAAGAAVLLGASGWPLFRPPVEATITACASVVCELGAPLLGLLVPALIVANVFARRVPIAPSKAPSAAHPRGGSGAGTDAPAAPSDA
ncbi:MAG: alkaline phosphatase family protein [Myxococcales bacterium]|nr:alkaline phosphatase family protein [Myxococcales bacterium]